MYGAKREKGEDFTTVTFNQRIDRRINSLTMLNGQQSGSDYIYSCVEMGGRHLFFCSREKSGTKKREAEKGQDWPTLIRRAACHDRIKGPA
jgi:hypothetical protein